MDKEKQIEKMANIINEMDKPNAHYYDDENLEQHEVRFTHEEAEKALKEDE